MIKEIRTEVLQCIKDNKLSGKSPEEIVAERADISYRITDMSNIAEGDASGLIFYQGDKFLIGVSSTIHENRRRFTLAHELGHYFLDRDFLTDTTKEGFIVDEPQWLYRYNSTDDMPEEMRKREIRANIFAAEILMPEEKVREFYNITNNISVLADTFKVSEKAMTFRLFNLGLGKDD